MTLPVNTTLCGNAHSMFAYPMTASQITAAPKIVILRDIGVLLNGPVSLRAEVCMR